MPGDDSFIYPKSVHFLPLEVSKKDDSGRVITDNDGNPETEIKRSPVFSGKVHSECGECIIDEYFSFAKKLSEEMDKEEGEEYFGRLTKFVKGSPEKSGIKVSNKWTGYVDSCDKDGKSIDFGRTEVAQTVVDKMNEISAGEDEVDDVMETDPFTDPDTGRILKVTFNKDATKISDYYKCSIDIKKESPLTDEQLEAFSKERSLKEQFVNVYTTKDFELAMEGLQRFDEEFEMEVFTYDEFFDTCERLSALYPEPSKDDNGKDDKPETSNESSASENGSSNALPWDVDELDLKGLKAYIKKEELNIRVLSRYSVEDVREIIKEEEALMKQGLDEGKAVEAEGEPKKEEKPKRERRKRRTLQKKD